MSDESFVNKLVTCPYDPVHKVKASRFQIHIAKCRMNHLDKSKKQCPFNAKHLVNPEELDHHVLNCPDRAPLDRKLAQNLDRNNPFKGNTAVPPCSSHIPKPDFEECWDDEMAENVVTFNPNQKPPPPNAIIEPPALSKPSERKKLYSELRLRHNQAQGESKGPSTVLPIPRQPKQLSETQKLQNARNQLQLHSEAIQNLGFGRGRAQTRIAANIFDQSAKPASQPRPSIPISEVVNGMARVGLGRGQPAPVFADDDFPALG